MITIKKIIKEAKTFLPDLNEERVKHAYEFAKKAHEGQKRLSGTPYILHPLEVAHIALSLKPDEDTIVAALLHDVLEDTEVTLDTISREFGQDIIPLLRGLEKLSTVHYRGLERHVENLRKMFLAMAQDIRVIFIKLADRLHNIRTLHHISREDKRQRIAQETLSIYSPIASRLGIYKIKNELDTICFKHLHPREFFQIENELKDIIGDQGLVLKNNVIKRSTDILMRTLKKEGVQAMISGRVKNPYSIYKKLKQKNKNYVSELYDIFALRIIVETEAQCYQVLGLIHKHWTPLSRRFKDYIALPKSNGYKSLHTTIIGLANHYNNQPVEIQIRTKEMDEIAEFGIAAHWHYDQVHQKDNKQRHYLFTENARDVNDLKLPWVKSLVDLHENLKSNAEFIETLNVDVFKDRIFVLTPKGDVFDLPYGATPVDFAYAVHTTIGHRCKGAKVNGEIVKLNHPLRNGEVVHIITDHVDQPNRYWLSFVVTSKAKTHIKEWFNNQDRENMLKAGKDILNKKLDQLNQPLLDPHLSLLKNYDGEKLPIREREHLLEKVGNGSLNPIEILKKVLPTEAILKPAPQKQLNQEILSEGVNFHDQPEILITGEKGFKTQIASCCQPSPEHLIVGYITRGRGVTIHKQNCKVINGLDENRLVRTSWSTQKIPKYTVKLKVERRSRIGLLRDVADVFAQNQLPILDIENVRSKNSDHGYFIVTVSLDSFDTLNTLFRQIENVNGVFSVKEVD